MTVSIKLTVVLLLAGAAMVLGHDFAGPAWRTEDGTTYQHWTFDSNANPAPPEAINNTHGQAAAIITVGEYGEGWLEDLGFTEQTGIWDIGGADGNIVLSIANHPGPLESVDVWLQVTFYKFTGISEGPIINVVGAQFISGEFHMIEEDLWAPGNGWLLQQSLWRIEGGALGPILLAGSPFGTRIDQIVVDVKSVSTTVCIIDFDDLADFCDEWLNEGDGLAADLNNSGTVDGIDFSMFAKNWFQPCP